MTRSSMRALVLAIAIAGAGAGITARTARAQDSGIEIGARAPSALVQTLDAKAYDLASLVGTQPVVLEFWAVWCSNCRELEPAMKALHAKYGKRVRFAGVAVSANQSAELVRRYVAKHAIPWFQVYDARGKATGAYDVPATSYVVVLDRTGKVVYTGLGGKQPALEAAIRGTL